MPEALGSQGSPCSGVSCSTVRGWGVPAGSEGHPGALPSAPGDSAGTINAPRIPLVLLGASSGHHNEHSVIFCCFKLDFKRLALRSSSP